MENKYEKTYGNLKVIQKTNFQWGVEDLDGNIIVAYGKYVWIDGFDSGLARVKRSIPIVDHKDPLFGSGITNDKWGIINEKGEEVLPAEYDNIWNFLGKGRDSTRVEKNHNYWQVYFKDLNTESSQPQDEAPEPYCPESYNPEYEDPYDDYGHNYGEYEGTYAQDVAGYSDDVIDDAFDGDPDAYWNID